MFIAQIRNQGKKSVGITTLAGTKLIHLANTQLALKWKCIS